MFTSGYNANTTIGKFVICSQLDLSESNLSAAKATETDKLLM